jgi:hypothetical protein
VTEPIRHKLLQQRLRILGGFKAKAMLIGGAWGRTESTDERRHG